MNTFYQLYACYTYGVYPKYTQMRITLCILNIYTSSITAFFHSGRPAILGHVYCRPAILGHVYCRASYFGTRVL